MHRDDHLSSVEVVAGITIRVVVRLPASVLDIARFSPDTRHHACIVFTSSFIKRSKTDPHTATSVPWDLSRSPPLQASVRFSPTLLLPFHSRPRLRQYPKNGTILVSVCFDVSTTEPSAVSWRYHLHIPQFSGPSLPLLPALPLYILQLPLQPRDLPFKPTTLALQCVRLLC